MRQTALQHLLRPGSTELELAQAAEVMARQTEPLLGPMVEDLLRLALRHSFQIKAVNATERHPVHCRMPATSRWRSLTSSTRSQRTPFHG